ncbi:hypothetical protein NIES25_07640 [Nostoc linckia NIES-25]|nr:hypothetical protein NIES25_07640 [Nostoc linckia NIES-25]
MKLLSDENLSPKLSTRLSDIFPGSLHVRDVFLLRHPGTGGKKSCKDANSIDV